MGGFLEVLFFGMEDIAELLGVAVDDREPCALDLDHNPMPLAEAVAFVTEIKFDLSHPVRHKRLRFLEAVPVFAAHDFTSYEHLKISHSHVAWIRNVVGSIAGIDVD